MLLRTLLLGAIALVSACTQEPTAPAAIEEYWTVALPPLPNGARPLGVQYVNAASIQEFDGARTVFVVGFGASPTDPTRAGTRLDIVNDYDCANRRVRTVSLTIRIGASQPSTTRGNGEWTPIDDDAQLQPLFEFVCGTPASRAADQRFTRVTDARPIQDVANDAMAALAAETR